MARRDQHPQIHAGTSGWVYMGWRKHLYAGAPARRWLKIASRTFSSLEINGSFYSQISPATYARWRAETPADFRFALKGHRFVTHYKRLRDCEASIVLLRDQASHLGDKLGAVVWQLPASFAIERARLDDFLVALRRWPVRHAIELRHRSWFVPEVATQLRDAGVAVCISDAPDFPMWREVTADFVYVRLHGHTRKYASSYSAASLQRWAAEVRRWTDDGRDVFVYFDNDAEGHAVRNALAFDRLVGPASPMNPAGSMSRDQQYDRHTICTLRGMPRGSTSKYTSKQKRQARHIEKSAKERGYSSQRAAQIGHATVNQQDHGGKKSGSGRGEASNKSSSRAGGRASASSRRGGSRAAHARAGRAAHRR